MPFININVKTHLITPQDVDALNDPGENKAPIFNEGRHSLEWREVGYTGAGGDMRKATYDRTDSGIVDNAGTLQGSTLTQVRDHAPKGHNNDVHLHNILTTCDKYSKEYMALLGIDIASLEGHDLTGVRTHAPLTHGNSYHSGTYVTTCDKYTKAAQDALGINAATLGGKTLGVGADNIAFYDVNGRVADVTKVKGTTVDATNIGADKLLAYDETTKTLVYKTLAELAPALNADGKLILTGSAQIGTKTGDLAELWDKATKLVTGDLEASEFNAANKIPTLDASTFLNLTQVVGNIPGLNAAGKLVLTQVGAKVTDLATLWDKTTKLVTTDFNNSTFDVADGMVKLDASAKIPYATVPEVGGVATFVVAASNSENKNKADYICTSTDDQGKIIEAIGDLPAGGGSIVLLEGTYTIDTDNDPVTVNALNNITIQGQGKGTKLCLGTGITSNIIEISNASGITIRDLYVDGTTTVASGGDDLKQCGIIFITVTDSKIRNVHSLSNKMYGINLITGSERNAVIGCICKSNYFSGLIILSSTYNILWNNVSTANTFHGAIAGDNSHNNTIYGNALNNNGDLGIWITGSDNNAINGNLCNSNGSEGMNIGDAHYNTIVGNLCCNCSVSGIRLTNASHYNTIFSNIESGNDVGTYIPNGDSNVIASNTCYNNTYGIYAISECLTITGNSCYDCAQNGVLILNYGKNVIFGNNACNNTTDGITIQGNHEYNTVVGNTMEGNGYMGIYIYLSNYNTIRSNTCLANGWSGIELYTSSDNSISGNTSMSNSQTADNFYDDIAIRENSDYNNIQRNTCRAGSGAIVPAYGINVLDPNCTESFMTNNDIYNDNYGTASLNIAVGSGTVTTPGNRTA